MIWKNWPYWVKSGIIGAAISWFILLIIAAFISKPLCNGFPDAGYGVRVDGYDGGEPYRKDPCSSTETFRTFVGLVKDAHQYFFKAPILMFAILIGFFLGSVTGFIVRKIKYKNN